MILVTGGAGFIGSNFIRSWFVGSNEQILNFDSLTYAGDLERISGLDNNLHKFVRGNILDRPLLVKLLFEYQPRAIIHFAAESHVDRSILGPEAFLETNVFGTFRLLDAAKEYWSSLDKNKRIEFRFIHISTDEVYGTLNSEDEPFSENSPYSPNSPYAASKASSDHFVRSFYQTYNFPSIITNCSNNYGPYQHPEKLIPLMILKALSGQYMPIYGDGSQIRDWLHVSDHCSAIKNILEKGTIGETYCIGGDNENQNIIIVKNICSILDELVPLSSNEFCRRKMIHKGLEGNRYSELINYVKDRPGHDTRYAINFTKLSNDLGWKPNISFSDGLRATIKWYLNNKKWLNRDSDPEFQAWLSKQYGN